MRSVEQLIRQVLKYIKDVVTVVELEKVQVIHLLTADKKNMARF